MKTALANKKIFSICWILLIATAICGSSVTFAATRVGDFALLDNGGYFHQMSYYDDHKAIAFLVQSNGSAETEKSLIEFTKLQKKYGDDIQFFMINPTGAQSAESVSAQAQKYGTNIPILMDYNQLVSEGMAIDKVGETLLYDPKEFAVIYRGPAKKYLAAAIKQVMVGEEIKTAMVETKGASVSYPAREKDEVPSYVNDVAPILAENCARCHREDGIAPFAMNSALMARGWSKMMKEVILTKRMPPGQVDPHIGNIKETYALTKEEERTIVNWANAGAPTDVVDGNDPLAALTWPESKWGLPELGEPDFIIKVPAQEVPATGILDYRYITVPIDIDRDRYVRASQYLAGDRTVLHHTLNALVPPGQSNNYRGFLGGGDPNEARITAYIPGAMPQVEPPHTGGLLRKGSKISLQLHYTTNGKATVDESEIGLWFYDDDELPTERMTGECACIWPPRPGVEGGWVNIPPHDPDYEMSQTIVLKKDAYLYSMLPHMHFRGKRMRYYAEYPDGKKEELLNIAHYNYNWQLNYELAEPKFMPAGTKLIAVGAFDNSTQNKSNPDPDRSVPWGQQSWDEMFFGAFTWKYADQSEFQLTSK